jgi:hypothetical protein
VQDYLSRHPYAADTPAGITAWWIPGGVRMRPQAIQQALEHLVATGLLGKRRLPSGETLYFAQDGSDDENRHS